MTTLLVVLLFVAFLVAYFMLNTADDTAVQRCSICGLVAVERSYRGTIGGPAFYRCAECGTEFRAGENGELRPLT